MREEEEFNPGVAEAVIKIVVIFVVMLLLLGGSHIHAATPFDEVRVYTRGVEFDFVAWTVEALFNKAAAASLGAEKFLDQDQQADVVYRYIDQVNLVAEREADLVNAHAAPSVQNREQRISTAEAELTEAADDLESLGALAESIIQNQVELTLGRMGFGLGGQILPPVLYQVSDLPLNLIVSPRTEIRSEISLSLDPGLDASQKELIESSIHDQLDLSALVEPVGGLGAYPTMVMRTNSLNWLTETVAHEWIHNYLTFRPLGVRYFVDNQMRTINETTASLAGKEIGLQVMLRYYPGRVPRPRLVLPPVITVLREDQVLPESFVYRREMRETRVAADALLALGRVSEAEAYMEERRLFFWENGYQIRKINQAYFAFYGAYDDVPGGGAAGEDPVGPAVRELRALSPSLRSFIRYIERVRSFEELQVLLPR